MNLQEIQALPINPFHAANRSAGQQIFRTCFTFPARACQSPAKSRCKISHLLQTIALPESEPLKQLILELIAVNREIELTEAKYRKAATEEVHALAARITTLQNHKTRLSTTFITTLNT